MQLVSASFLTGDCLLRHKGQNAAAGDGRARARKTQPTFSSFPGFTTRCHRESSIAGPVRVSRMGFWGASRSSSHRRPRRVFPSSASVAFAGLCLSAEPLEKPSPGIQGSMEIEMQLKPFFSQRLAKPPARTLPGGSRASPCLKGTTPSRRDPRHLQQYGPLKQVAQTRPLWALSFLLEWKGVKPGENSGASHRSGAADKGSP